MATKVKTTKIKSSVRFDSPEFCQVKTLRSLVQSLVNSSNFLKPDGKLEIALDIIDYIESPPMNPALAKLFPNQTYLEIFGDQKITDIGTNVGAPKDAGFDDNKYKLNLTTREILEYAMAIRDLNNFFGIKSATVKSENDSYAGLIEHEESTDESTDES